MIIDPNEGNAP